MIPPFVDIHICMAHGFNYRLWNSDNDEPFCTFIINNYLVEYEENG